MNGGARLQFGVIAFLDPPWGRYATAALSKNGSSGNSIRGSLGAMLGAEMHEAYLAGSMSKSFLRSLFFRKIHLPGVAKKTYFELARRVNPAQGKLFS